MSGTSGAFLMFVGFVPVFAAMIVTADFSVLTGNTFWVSLGVAIGLGLAAAVTAVGSGLNAFGTMLTFVLSFATTLYVALIAVNFSTLSAMPYYSVLLSFCSFCYVLGIFFVAGSVHA